jgi:hypothetical protein
MEHSGNLSENAAIANNVETTVFTLALPAGIYDLKYNIALQPADAKATYHKAWCWIDDLDKELIASNIALPHDWPTSKEVTVSITSDGSTPILIKALVDADDDVELMHAHDVVEKNMYGNDVTKKQGCFWKIS